MKIRALLASLVLALMLCVSTFAQTATVPAQTAEEFHKDLAKATLALYERHPHTQADDLFEIAKNKQKHASNGFVSNFTCTATVIDRPEPYTYILLTAGHCFHDDPSSKYYVSEGIDEDPTLQHVTILKKAHTKKYDYALLELHSAHEYPVIHVSYEPLPVIETPVVNINFSLGVTQQLVKGYIQSGIMERGQSADPALEGRFITSLGIGPGASGSAIVNENTHEIIGLGEMIFPGLAMGSVAMPIGKSFDNFMIDDSILEKAPAEVKKAVPLPPSIDHGFQYRLASIFTLVILLATLVLFYQVIFRKRHASKQAAPRAS